MFITAFWNIFVICIFAWFGVYLMDRAAIDRTYIAVAGFFWLISIFFMYVFVKFYLSHLPVRLVDEGIELLMFGRVHSFIAWRNVRSIEEIRYFDSLRSSNHKMYYVHGDEERIRFDDGLREFSQFLILLNERVQQYGIRFTRAD
jgi:hypothetical protein